MQFIKNQIKVELTRSELTAIINEAMQDPAANTAIKRAISSTLSTAFQQFPEHTQVTVGDTDAESGITSVSLKVPAVKKAVTEGTSVADEPAEDFGEESVA